MEGPPWNPSILKKFERERGGGLGAIAPP